MTAEPDFLASAYLDGELTEDERRIAEADPAVMAEVDAIRALRGRIADVTPPTDTAREAALAAAMGVFHERRAGATAPQRRPRRVLAFRRPIPHQRWLAVAAAVLVIGLLGVVIASGIRSGDDDAANESAAQPAPAPTDVVPSDRTAESAADDGAFESELAPAEAAEQSTAAATAAPAAEPAAEPASEPAAEAAAEPAGDMAAAAVDPALFFAFNVGEDARLPIEDADQLANAADYLLGLAASGQLPPTPESSCPAPMFARALLRHGDDVVEVLIGIDGDEATAYTEECAVLLTASLTP